MTSRPNPHLTSPRMRSDRPIRPHMHVHLTSPRMRSDRPIRPHMHVHQTSSWVRSHLPCLSPTILIPPMKIGPSLAHALARVIPPVHRCSPFAVTILIPVAAVEIGSIVIAKAGAGSVVTALASAVDTEVGAVTVTEAEAFTVAPAGSVTGIPAIAAPVSIALNVASA